MGTILEIGMDYFGVGEGFCLSVLFVDDRCEN